MAAMAAKDSDVSSLGNNSKEDESVKGDNGEQWKRRNARKWVATIWVAAGSSGGAPANFADFDKMCRSLVGLSRWCGQIEKCPKSEKLHWQVYFEFEKCVRAGPAFERIFGQNYFRPAKHGPQAIRYSTKSESRHEGPWAWSADGDTKWADSDGSFESTKPKKDGNVVARDSTTNTITPEQTMFNLGIVARVLRLNPNLIPCPVHHNALSEIPPITQWTGVKPIGSGSKPETLPVPNE